MAYEAVHPVESWKDLKNRLDQDRRFFAFFHPRMPEEPLIFLEVALVRGMTRSIQDLLDPAAPALDPEEADTAIFYSISNAQKGLAGVSFGGFLIKRVVDRLARELPHVKTHATLSPMPGFLGWLRARLAEGEELLLSGEEKRLRRAGRTDGPASWLEEVLEESEWIRDADLAEALEPTLLRLAARYLTQEKGRGGRALDPVAHFHLSNGARVERLNWMADLSPKGLAQSAGMMVNYLYDARHIEENHEAYRGEGRVVTSAAVRRLLKG